MKFIDFHTHIYPEKIVLRATEYLSSTFGKDAEWPGSSENLIIFGKAAGISKFVVLPVAMKENGVRKINEFVIKEAKDYPEEIVPFGTVHAAQENIIDELDFIKASGLKGIKIHPNQQDFPLDDKRLFDCYKYLSETGMPVLFHCGDKNSDYSNPLRLKKVIKEFPKLRIVAAHFGGWTVFDQAYDLLRNENIHFDMSSSMYILGLEKTAKYIKDFGVEKIFFGSDFPLCEQSEEIKKFMMLDLTDEEKEKVAWKNADDFLKVF